MDSGKAGSPVLSLISMKRFKEIVRWCGKPERLFVWFVFVLSIPNAALCFTEQMPPAARACNLVLPVSAYWFAMTLSRKPGKVIWILFPLVFFAAFQLVLLYLFGRSIIAVDMFLNLVTTNSGEAMELLDNLLPAVVGVFVVYLPSLAWGVASIAGSRRLHPAFLRRQRRYALAGIGAGTLLLGAAYLTGRDYAVKTDLYPVNVCYNLALAVERAGETARYAEGSKGFAFGAVPTHDAGQPEVYVLVVGETARACNFGLYGYGRDTTPLLDRTEGLAVFTDVLTQSNTTHKSVPMLLSAASAEDYDCLYRQKGILTAFKEAGFHTAFFSNQRPNRSFIDFFGQEADEWRFVKEDAPEGANLSDDELLSLVAEALRKGHRKLFVVLHAYGSHFNYKERYPAATAVFKPDSLTDAKYENRAYLRNAYDNTIRYTDGLLAELIRMLQRTGAASAMLYTSDHGEDLFDDGRRLFLHASPVPSYYQLHVPFLVWMSAPYRRSNAAQYRAVWENRAKPVAANASVFHTLLDLAGIRTPYRNDSLSVAGTSYAVRPRRYLNDHNLPKPLDKIGLKKEDIDQMRQRRLAFP